MLGQRILVVGGAGFVGSNLVRMLLDLGAEGVTIVDNLLSAEEINVPKSAKIDFIHGSITDDQILGRLDDNFDYVFHLATYHGNQSSIYDPLADHENNTLTTLKLFNRLKKFKKLKKLVYSSAGCSVAAKTFDSPEATSEEAPINLIQDSPYSISKVIGEFYSVYFFRSDKLPVVRARFQNVFGPHEILGAGKWRGTPATVWRNVTPTFIFKSLKHEALPVDNGGVATRDFIFVDDICRGLISCAERGEPGDVYNLASGYEITILELANAINRITGNPTPIAFKPKRDWDNSGRRYGDPSKSENTLGFRAVVPFEDGLKITIDWTRQNLSMIESVMHKHDQQMAKSTL
jgi:nucleoside-diphosphate-sugar epimerase